MARFFLILILLIPSGASAAWEANFETELYAILSESPRYKMNDTITPDAPTSDGVDCSRLFYLAQKRAGGVRKRVTSKNMALGRGGWEAGTVDTLPEAQHLDLFFWTLSALRENGHVGILLILDKVWNVGHASSGRGHTVVEEIPLVEPFSWITKKLQAIRRM